MTIREVPCRNRELTTANGLARLVRRRWPTKTIECAMAEWDLSEGMARGLVYAQASRTCVDLIKRHPRGGWRVFLEVDALVIGERVDQWIEREHTRILNDRAAIDAEAGRLAKTAARLRAAADGHASGGAR